MSKAKIDQVELAREARKRESTRKYQQAQLAKKREERLRRRQEILEHFQQKNSAQLARKKKVVKEAPAEKPKKEKEPARCLCGCGTLLTERGRYPGYVDYEHYLRAFRNYGRRREVPKEDQMAVEQILNGGQRIESEEE